MPYLTTFRIEGDPDELLKFKQEVMDPRIAPVAKENGAIEHIVVKTETGLTIFNLWETIEGSEKTSEAAREAAMEAGEDAGGQPQDWQSYEIVQREVV